ncbi:hypothetical protein BZK31_26245 [Pseudomonas floridensis]|uniref:Uncharacterized protein n=1 Tax=Pseudomonas floridensis TaxID=1958950 RepID=A0A1X0MYK6_9PSED|nr:hypothetical protein [Pseudomonas floridensis]ORC54197.1 hypothetical protein BZK31_26245 [Pseudomonas floridensis]
MDSNQAISQALKIRFAAFKGRKDDDYESEGIAHGAAHLALDVGIITNDALLIAQAQEVITAITDSWQLEEEQDLKAMANSYADWDASQEKHRQAYRMIKDLVGKEFHDSRWEEFIEIYQKTFPTFLVRDSVYARIGPKQAATRLRKDLADLVKAKRLDRAPTPDELQALLPPAKALLEDRTIRYLEGALPGFDFRNHSILNAI